VKQVRRTLEVRRTCFGVHLKSDKFSN